MLKSFNPHLQPKDTKSASRNKSKDLLTKLKGFKFVAILVLEFEKIDSHYETKYSTFYLSSKAETIINKNYIDGVFESVYTKIISIIRISLGKGSGWIIDSVVNHKINILKYRPLSGSNYIKLPKELDPSRKV